MTRNIFPLFSLPVESASCSSVLQYCSSSCSLFHFSSSDFLWIFVGSYSDVCLSYIEDMTRCQPFSSSCSSYWSGVIFYFSPPFALFILANFLSILIYRLSSCWDERTCSLFYFSHDLELPVQILPVYQSSSVLDNHVGVRKSPSFFLFRSFIMTF